jgi:hypothetical protein
MVIEVEDVVEDVDALEATVVDKVKMKKEPTTTMHVVEDTVMVETVAQIDTMLIVIIVINMVIMQASIIMSRR